jgi:hypothetical protein
MSNPISYAASSLLNKFFSSDKGYSPIPDASFGKVNVLRIQKECMACKKAQYIKQKLSVLDLVPVYKGVLADPRLFKDPALIEQAKHYKEVKEKLDGKIYSLNDRSIWSLVQASYAMMTAARRTLLAHTFVKIGYENLDCLKTAEDSYNKINSWVKASGGVFLTLGRLVKYYPRKNLLIEIPTDEEVRLAFLHSGVPDDQNLSANNSRSIRGGAEMVDHIKINSGSEAGYPTKGKLNDPAVLEMNILMAEDIRAAVGNCKTYAEAKDIFDVIELQVPSMFTYIAKTKSDVYSIDKLLDSEARLYTVLSAAVRIAIFPGSQGLESVCGSINIEGEQRSALEAVRTFKGSNYTKSGASKMVAVMEALLEQEAIVAVTNGDDSFIVASCLDGVVKWSNDCSSFDITQRYEVMEPIRRKLIEKVALVDPVSAFVLERVVMEEKQIVLTGACTYKMRHSSLSGTPLVSVANDVAMQVFATRHQTLIKNKFPIDKTTGRLSCTISELTEEFLLETMKVAALTMGFTVKLADYDASHSMTLGGSLTTPFMFCGYNLFQNQFGHIVACIDIARQFGQLSYPSSYIVENELVQVIETTRLASSFLNFGYPQEHLKRSFAAMAAYSVSILDKQIEKFGEGYVGGEVVTLYGVDHNIVPSLGGLRRAIIKGTIDLYTPEMLEGETLEEYQTSGPFTCDRFPDLAPLGYKFGKYVEARESSSAIDYQEFVRGIGEQEVLKQLLGQDFINTHQLARIMKDSLLGYVIPYQATEAHFGKRAPTRATKSMPFIQMDGSTSTKVKKRGPRPARHVKIGLDAYDEYLETTIEEEFEDEEDDLVSNRSDNFGEESDRSDDRSERSEEFEERDQFEDDEPVYGLQSEFEIAYGMAPGKEFDVEEWVRIAEYGGR